MLEQIAEGRTDLVFDYLAAGHPPAPKTSDGSSLIQWCAYYGDVSAIKTTAGKGRDTSVPRNGHRTQCCGFSWALAAMSVSDRKWRECELS